MTEHPPPDLRGMMAENLPLIWEARQRRRAAEEDARQLTDPVKEWMLAAGEERLESGDYTATLQLRPRSDEYDFSALSADQLADLAAIGGLLRVHPPALAAAEGEAAEALRRTWTPNEAPVVALIVRRRE